MGKQVHAGKGEGGLSFHGNVNRITFSASTAHATCAQLIILEPNLDLQCGIAQQRDNRKDILHYSGTSL